MHTLRTCMRLFSAIFALTLLVGCASSSSSRPQVDPEPYPDASFSGVLDHSYYVTVPRGTSLAEKEPKDGVRYVKTNDPAFQTLEIVGGREAIQDTLDRINQGFVCPVRGTVYVSALLDREGTVRAPQPRAGIHEACDQKALEVIQRLQLRPARLEGKPISVLFTLPVAFR